MDEETIQKLASEAVAIFLSDWKDTPETQVVERNGNNFLIVKPVLERRNLFSGITLQFNLEDKCRYDLRQYFPGSSNEEEQEAVSHLDPENFTRQRLPKELARMAITATQLLPFFLEILDIAALHRRMEALLGPLSHGPQAEISEIARELTQLMLRSQGFITKEEPKPGPSRAIDDRNAVEALLRIGSTSPSRRQLAKELNTTPSTVRSWLRMKGFTSPEELMDDFLKRIREARGVIDEG
jgi:hypothetical protein